MRRTVPILLALALVVAACNRGEDETATTTGPTLAESASTSRVTTTSSASSAASTVPADTTVATTTAVVVGLPSYEVVEATSGSSGDALVVVVEPGAYSNVELENLVYDIVDRFAPASAVVVDQTEAVALLALAELDDAQRDFLAAHTLLEITDGVEVTFLGPYADIPRLTVGS